MIEVRAIYHRAIRHLIVSSLLPQVDCQMATEAEFTDWRATWPGSVVGTLLSAEVDHREAVYARPVLLLMGNEQQGLTPDLAALCDVNVKIPMRGRADSLNLSVATGVMIYAATG